MHNNEYPREKIDRNKLAMNECMHREIWINFSDPDVVAHAHGQFQFEKLKERFGIRLSSQKTA